MAILTTEDLDAATVEPATVVFAGASWRHFGLKDVDNDGDVDLVLHFECQQVNLDSHATEACLEGETYDGQQVGGCDSVMIVPSDSAKDSDKDGFRDAVEACMGTNLWDDCPDSLSDDAWPPDIRVNTLVEVADALLFLEAYPSVYSTSPNYSQRLDLVASDGVVDVADALAFLSHFPSACTNP